MGLQILIPCSAFFQYTLIFPNNKNLEPTIIAWVISVDIISRIIFLNKILKIDLYKHHKISIIFLIVGFIPLIIRGIYDTINHRCGFYLLFFIPRNIFFPLGDTISKILLTNKFILPQNLVFYKGCFNFCMHAIALPILILTKCLTFKDEGGNSYFENFTFLSIMVIFINIIFSFGKAICIMQIIYLFTPQHVCLVNIVSTLIIFVKNCFCANTQDWTIVINIICFLIVIFGTLVFSEMIIINACDLNINTKSEIIERQQKEINQLNSSLMDYSYISKNED